MNPKSPDAPEVRRYLASMLELLATMPGTGPANFAYKSLDAFLAAEGQAFPIAADQTFPLAVSVYPQNCFDNAYRLAKRYPSRYRYVEGMALGVIPVHHAWVLTREGFVIDPTWVPYSTVGTEYFGVVVPLAIAAQVRTKANTSVLQNWQKGFPLFREPWATVLARGTVATHPRRIGSE